MSSSCGCLHVSGRRRAGMLPQMVNQQGWKSIFFFYSRAAPAPNLHPRIILYFQINLRWNSVPLFFFFTPAASTLFIKENVTHQKYGCHIGRHYAVVIFISVMNNYVKTPTLFQLKLLCGSSYVWPQTSPKIHYIVYVLCLYLFISFVLLKSTSKTTFSFCQRKHSLSPTESTCRWRMFQKC